MVVDGICATKCMTPCSSCSSTDNSLCTSCIGGYTFSNQTNECNPDLTCNDKKTCSSCPLGYSLSGGVCGKCNSGDNCAVCNINNATVCAFCNYGFYLNGTCQKCNV